MVDEKRTGVSMGLFAERIRRRLSRGATATAASADQMCVHLRSAPRDTTPKSQTCAACDAQGTYWNDLRLCVACGEVGCCDSSPWQHASSHAKETGHPVMRSFAHGESWRWCYVDEQLG